MKNALLAIPLLAAGVLTAGCTASSTSAAVSAVSPAGAASAGASGGPSASASSAGATSAAASPAASQAAAGPGAVPSCKSADLEVSLGGGSGAGMSQDHTGLQLRNIGPSTCTLYGYPGVSWVAGADGHQVGAPAVRQPGDNGSAELTVTLAPGALASAPLDLVDAAVLSPSDCKPVQVRGLRVYPPGEQAALFLPTGTGGSGECSLVTKQPTLTIGYLQPGPQPAN